MAEGVYADPQGIQDLAARLGRDVAGAGGAILGGIGGGWLGNTVGGGISDGVKKLNPMNLFGD